MEFGFSLAEPRFNRLESGQVASQPQISHRPWLRQFSAPPCDPPSAASQDTSNRPRRRLLSLTGTKCFRNVALGQLPPLLCRRGPEARLPRICASDTGAVSSWADTGAPSFASCRFSPCLGKLFSFGFFSFVHPKSPAGSPASLLSGPDAVSTGIDARDRGRSGV